MAGAEEMRIDCRGLKLFHNTYTSLPLIISVQRASRYSVRRADDDMP